jgi:hypothetical protein
LAALQPVTTTSRLIAAMMNAKTITNYELAPDTIMQLWNAPTVFPPGFPSVDSFLEETWSY